MAPPRLTAKARYLQRLTAMKAERASYESHWQEIADFIRPRRYRPEAPAAEQGRRGTKAMDYIVNAKATSAVGASGAGMHTGITSAARPWYRLKTSDPALNEVGTVKDYLYQVTQRMNEVFARSNFYAVAPKCYEDLLTFATSCVLEFEDDEDVVRFYSLQPGTYWLGQNARLQVDTIFRRFAMTVRQLVLEYGGADGAKLIPGQAPDLTRFSSMVRQCWETGAWDRPVSIVGVIEPNDAWVPGAANPTYDRMPFRACYFEESTPTEGDLLRETGYLENPILAPRWDVDGEAVYGRGPGMLALPDVKQLQQMEKRKLEAIDKYVRPPMVAPTSLRGKGVNLTPGGVTYFDGNAGTQQFQPAYAVKPEIQHLLMDIAAKERQIDQMFFVDLFQAVSRLDPRTAPRTAREIEELATEKQTMLAPLLERLNGEWLDPVIDRTFGIMNRQGLLPEPPEELQGTDLRVEYISPLFQAQRAVATSGLERVTTFAVTLGPLVPDALDKVDFDQVIDEYGDAIGLAPRVIRTDAQVAEIRAQRAKQQAAMQAAAAAKPVAEAAKAASETSMEGDTALTRMMAGMPGGEVAA